MVDKIRGITGQTKLKSNQILEINLSDNGYLQVAFYDVIWAFPEEDSLNTLVMLSFVTLTGSQGIAMQVFYFGFVLPMGFGVAAGIRVGQNLGSANVDGARTTVNVSLFTNGTYVREILFVGEW